MYIVRRTDRPDKKIVHDVLEIDSMVYPKHLQGTFGEIYDRFNACNDMFILLYDNQTLIGYLCLFPIKKSLYERITGENRLFDSDIPGEMIERYEPNNTYTLYFLSAAIHPEYQKRGLSTYLRKGFFQFLVEKKKNGIYFSAALSTAVTDSGKAMLEKIGFTTKKVLPDDYILFELIIDETTYSLAEGIA